MSNKDQTKLHFTAKQQADLMDIMFARRDVRGNNFTSETITDADLEKIFQAAWAAPSVGLSQPWEFVLVDSPQLKQQIYQNSKIEKQRAEVGFDDAQATQYRDMKLEGILEAPINIAVYYQPPETKIIGNNTMPEMGQYSVVCAVQNMWLMARSLNIGMGWVSIIDPELVSKLLSVPKHLQLVAYLCLGHCKSFLDSPEFEQNRWAKREPIEKSISYGKFGNKKD